jgi:hypothetical protein
LVAVWATMVALGGCLAIAEPAQAAQQAAGTAAPPPVRSRNILRKKIEQKVAVGTNLIGLEFEVLATDSAGNTVAVDAEKHAFAIGDSFVVKITPQDDVYVYVFTQGPTGTWSRLLPSSDDPDEKPLFVKQGTEVKLPESDLFVFEEPAGEEKLVVVASKTDISDLKWLDQQARKSGGRKLTSEEQKLGEQSSARLENLRQRASTVRDRGPAPAQQEKVEKAAPIDLVGKQFVKDHSDDSTGTEVVNIGASEIIFDIPLRSRMKATSAK